jgi:hypothetical protein
MQVLTQGQEAIFQWLEEGSQGETDFEVDELENSLMQVR